MASVGTLVLHVDQAALTHLLQNRDGPVMRDIAKRAELVKQEAVATCPVHVPPAGDTRSRERSPGTLRDSHVKRYQESAGVLGVAVVAQDDVAMLVHEGTEAHTISPVNKPSLVFWSGRYGRVIKLKAGRSVNHPGTKANPWLRNALGRAG